MGLAKHPECDWLDDTSQPTLRTNDKISISRLIHLPSLKAMSTMVTELAVPFGKLRAASRREVRAAPTPKYLSKIA
ncbi:hypothetical protein [Nostoc sp.]